MKKRPPTKLYQTLEDKLKELGNSEEELSKLRNPPYIEDLQPSLEKYISKIREMQKIVVEQVCNIELILTETDGVDYGHLFDMGMYAVTSEFDNWGLGEGSMYKSYFVNTGHFWVTIKSARFRSNYQGIQKKSMEKIKDIRNELDELYAPILSFKKVIRNYRDVLIDVSPYTDDDSMILWKAEQDRVGELKEKFEAETYLIRKNILSLSFVNSLIYKLEQSLDLSRQHPGD